MRKKKKALKPKTITHKDRLEKPGCTTQQTEGNLKIPKN